MSQFQFQYQYQFYSSPLYLSTLSTSNSYWSAMTFFLPSILSETSLRTIDPSGGQKVDAPGRATITDSTGYSRDFSSSLTLNMKCDLRRIYWLSFWTGIVVSYGWIGMGVWMMRCTVLDSTYVIMIVLRGTSLIIDIQIFLSYEVLKNRGQHNVSGYVWWWSVTSFHFMQFHAMSCHVPSRS